VGHSRLSNEGRWTAAVLACGPGAALSHRAAAALWRLLPPRRGLVDVTVPGSAGRKQRRDIRLHRSTTLTQQATTLRLGISVTSPARTLLDLRRIATPEELGRAHRQAEVFGYQLDDAARIEPDPTRSELERRFLRLCRQHPLPSPEVNAQVGDCVVDFLWRRARLIVETDGYRYHRGRAAFEHDHARQARLIALGYEVLRFTWRQVVDEPEKVIAALRARLTPLIPGPTHRG
jgi:very-short-patch-repair endonuclease